MAQKSEAGVYERHERKSTLAAQVDHADHEPAHIGTGHIVENAHLRQILFYLYYLKQKGVDAQGVMNYPLLNQTREVILTPDDEKNIEDDMRGIEEIVTGRMPHPKRTRICPKCAYFEFCFCGGGSD